MEEVTHFECCGNCRFFEGPRSQCKRYPPGSGSLSPPKIDFGDWCGEFDRGEFRPDGAREFFESLARQVADGKHI